MNRLVLFAASTLILVTSGVIGAEPQLTQRAATRATQLKAAISTFELKFFNYYAYYNRQDGPRWGVLHVKKWYREFDSPNGWGVTIDTDQANTIIDHLASSGFLDQAAFYEAFHAKRPAKNPCYILEVSAGKDGEYVLFQENLGWGLPMLKRLEELRAVLKGDAAEKVDGLLARLEKHRNEWENEPPLDPNAKTFPEGWELHIWEGTDGTYSSLVPHKHKRNPDKESIQESQKEVPKAMVKGIDAAKSKLKELRPWQAVTITGEIFTDKPPKEQTAIILKYCDELRLETWLPHP